MGKVNLTAAGWGWLFEVHFASLITYLSGGKEVGLKSQEIKKYGFWQINGPYSERVTSD